MMRHYLPLLMLCAASVCTNLFAEGEWKIVPGHIVTDFAKDVNPHAPLPEYPRPQLKRQAWKNLNGLWDYSISDHSAPNPAQYDGKILVPFAVESALSGVGKTVGKDQQLIEHTTFTVPKEWNGKRIKLNFGAADWKARVVVNGKVLGEHTGGYTPFSFDITDVLKDTNDLTVMIHDPTDESFQPRGKQVRKPGGIMYTAVTGIWDTVWLEPVAETHIEKLKLVPNIKNNTLLLTAKINGLKDGDLLEATVTFPQKEGRINRRSLLRGGGTVERTVSSVVADTTDTSKPLVLPVPQAKLWSPDEPNLYNLKVSIIRNGKELDTVTSYFGMREIALGKDDKGTTRMMLNGKFLFQHGPLDQGWHPDGLYTAATDEALRYDLEITKKLGFNMLRKHVKVEPLRFYRHCDELGILVWQDMPSGDSAKSDLSKQNYEKEWSEIIDALYNEPCIIVWVPFNEGWGQFDTCRILSWTKELDPTRLVDGPSGWTDKGCGDMHDKHQYRGPGMNPPEEKRATVLGEYGGLGLPIPGHTWVESDKNWGYGGNIADREALLETYLGLNKALHPLIAKGLSAAVYTQTTDCEVEVNGLLTYDRKIIKMDPVRFRESMDALHYAQPECTEVVPVKSDGWQYTFDKPADDWFTEKFKPENWKSGKAGFGGDPKNMQNVTRNTEWTTSDIWLRKTVELERKDLKDLILDIYHDEDAEIYVNGIKIVEVSKYTTDYIHIPLDAKQMKAFKKGTNTIAIHCKQTTGGQYIDAGLSKPEKVKHKERVW